MAGDGPQVGQGTVAIVPTFVGFRSATNKEMDAAAQTGSAGFKRAFARTGQDSGKQVGAGFKAAFDQQSTGFSDKAVRDLQASVTKATRTLSAARLKEQDLAGNVRVAEAQLAEARTKYASDSSQVVRAQERLAAAARKLGVAQDTTQASTEDLRAAQKRLADAADSAGDQLAQAGRRGGEGFKSGFLGGLSGLKAGVVGVIAAIGLGRIIESAVSGARDLVVGSIEIASDLNESINAVQVAYGDASSSVLKLGDNSAKSFGLSKRELNSYATQFSSFVQTIAGPGGDIAGTFRELVGRGSDFASVFNIDVAEALSTFQSGLAGESEPLRKYGIDLSAATVQAFAYSHGIAAAGSELTEAQKVQARYGALLAQTSKVQGDFANTSDQLANKNRINAASWDDIQAKIGTAFLPVAQSLATIIGDDLLPVIADLAEKQGPALAMAFKDALPAFLQLAKDVLPQLPGLFTSVAESLPAIIQLTQILVPLLLGIVQGTTDATAAVGAFFDLITGNKSIDEISAQMAGLTGPIGDVMRGAELLGAQWGASIGSMVAQGQLLSAQIGARIGEVVGFVQSLPDRAAAALAGAGDRLVSSGRAMIQGFIDGINDMLGPAGDAVNGVLSWVAGFFPHSPAKQGIFSGSGWTDLPKSGTTLLEHWSSGFSAGVSDPFTWASFASSGTTSGGGTSGIGSDVIPVTRDDLTYFAQQIVAGIQGLRSVDARASEQKALRGWDGGI
ncbi:hypothetical protein IC744_06705 [Microbacterium hominis]|uniref:hypothetical protein n=1 Tax=Microbacterium TaxID=33882 RepID=UPI00168AACF7|nr:MULTISPECIES: hypothetical protein [Microbacterium]QOC26040.1 hypothetical protein IC745_01025 [Microbacterium hominis]QOC30011.1 hypothetical protein IC744_06705 [Microbacterium hominis]QYF98447.1 hypothetical protein KY498_04170 [Microbacterium sp. PAMC21962]